MIELVLQTLSSPQKSGGGTESSNSLITRLVSLVASTALSPTPPFLGHFNSHLTNTNSVEVERGLL